MKAKEYLSQVKDMDRGIDRKQSNIDQLRELSTRVQGMRYDNERVQTSAKNTSEDLMIKIIDMETEINDSIDQYIDLRDKIVGQIEKLGNSLYSSILFKHYVLGKSLKSIAEEEYLSHDYVKHLHGYALQEFEQKFL